jgi:hypothetical protein
MEPDPSKVYILCGSYDHEGDTVLGAYESLEVAQAAAETVQNNPATMYDNIYIYEVIINAEPAMYMGGTRYGKDWTRL